MKKIIFDSDENLLPMMMLRPFNQHVYRLILMIMFSPYLLFAQNQWALKKDHNGIRVYTSAVPGSLFKAFRSVCTVHNTSLEEVAAVVLDVSHYDLLFPDTREVRLLEKKSDGHFIHYMVTDAPWPVEDRDGVYELIARQHPENKMITADIRCIRYPVPVKKNVVRMNRGEGQWILTELKDGQVEVSYRYHGEPEGSIPAWLANSSVVSIPYQTMKNLRARIASGQYKNAAAPNIR